MRRTSSSSVAGVQVSGASSMTPRTMVVPSAPPLLTTAWITSRKVSMPTSSPPSMTTSEPMSCWDMTLSADEPLSSALNVMSQHDIGSLVVMEGGELVGMLTFREVIQAVVNNGGALGTTIVRGVMDDAPLTCTPATELDEVRRMMLGRHARYMPVLSEKTLMGVVSFYDVAKAVVDSQDFENRMLKAYNRDWPVESLSLIHISEPTR